MTRARTHYPRGVAALGALLLLAILSGCGGNREAALIGKWKANASKMQLPNASSGNAAQQMGANMAKQMLSNMTIELKQDKTFAMTMMIPIEGTWAFNSADGTVALTPTKMMGIDISKMPKAQQNPNASRPMIAKLSDDNAHLTMQGNSPTSGPSNGSLTFDKQ